MTPPPRGLTTSVSLLAGLRAADPAAWERFVALYTPLLDHWFRAARVPPRDAPDVRQEVFVAVNRGVASFDRAGGGAFRGWLRAIARHKTADYHRRHLPLADPGHLAALPAPADDEREELGLLYRRAVELLQAAFEPSTWRAFWMVAVDGRPAADAARELGISPNAVYLARVRVLRRLREEFADFLAEDPPPGDARP